MLLYTVSMLRRIFGPKRKWQEAGEDCIMRSLMTCIHVIRVTKSRRMI
jgi:hypothetical protein